MHPRTQGGKEGKEDKNENCTFFLDLKALKISLKKHIQTIFVKLQVQTVQYGIEQKVSFFPTFVPNFPPQCQSL